MSKFLKFLKLLNSFGFLTIFIGVPFLVLWVCEPFRVALIPFSGVALLATLNEWMTLRAVEG